MPVGPPSLKRVLSFGHVVAAGIGMTIGAGIFAIMGVAAGWAGDAVWLSFFIAGLAAILTGLSYAELASMFPRAGAEYEYLSNAAGPKAGVLIGMLVIASCIIGSAMVISSCSEYAASLVPVPARIIAILLLPLFIFVLLRGVLDTARFVILFTIAEMGCLLILILVAVPFFGSHPVLAMPHGMAGVLSAGAMAFVAFAGFEGIVKLSEETIDAERVIPRALLSVLVFVTLLYAAAAFGAVSIAGWEALSASPTPVTLAFEEALGTTAIAAAVSAIIVLGTANSGIMVIFAASRIVYGMAQGGIFPKTFAFISPGRGVPSHAVAAVVLLVLPFVVLGSTGFLADLASFFFIATYCAINLGLILLRYHDPERERPFRIPFSVRGVPVSAALGLVVSVLLALLLPLSVIGAGVTCIVVLSLIALRFRTDVPEP